MPLDLDGIRAGPLLHPPVGSHDVALQIGGPRQLRVKLDRMSVVLLAFPERQLRFDLLVNVLQRAIPAEDSAFLLQRPGAAPEPPIRPIMEPQAVADVIGLAGRYGVAPRPPDGDDVVGMEGDAPAGTENLVFRETGQRGVARADLGHDTVRLGGPRNLRAELHLGAIVRLALAQPVLGRPDSAAQLQLRRGPGCERPERAELPVGQALGSRHQVKDTEDADSLPGDDERYAGVEAQARHTGNYGMVLEAVIPARVGHHQRCRCGQGLVEKGVGSGELERVEADARFEPALIAIDEGDQRDRRGAKLGRQVSKLTGRLEDLAGSCHPSRRGILAAVAPSLGTQLHPPLARRPSAISRGPVQLSL